MSFINQFKSQSKTVLAAVAISAATLGFAGGMSISKSSTGVSTQSQASLAQNNSAATNGATQSNSSTSSDEVNALKEKNQEIKAQISEDSSSSNQ